MTAFTEVLNLYLPGGGSLGIGGDDEVADIDRLNQNFQKIDAFAEGWGVPEKRNQQFYDLAAVRPNITDMKRGDTFQESDGEHRFWVFDGLNWVSAESGLYLISPSSVGGTGVTVSQGRVTAAGASEILINGVFSTRFRRYLVIVDIDTFSASTGINFQYRAGGANQTSNYYVQHLYNSSSTAVSTSLTGPASQADPGIGNSSSARMISLEIVRPASVAETLATGSATVIAGGHHLIDHLMMNHSVAMAVDGIRVFPGGGTFSGTVTVYGRA